MAVAQRFDQLSLGRGLTTENRIVLPPMASQTAASDGSVTERTREHYTRLARAGTGIAFVEYTYVQASGRSEPNQLGLTSWQHAAGLAGIARIFNNAGAVAGIQLTHAGGKSERSYTGGVLLGPSDVTVPVKDRVLESPTPMSEDEIVEMKAAFVTAAERAAAVGFNVIELHAAHGYGLNQWLSPFTNRRTDRYGDDAAGRRLIVEEIVREMRARVPSAVIAIRMPGRDFLDGGLSSEAATRLAQHLVAAGVDLIDVSSGLGGWRRPPERVGEGYLVPEAAAVQRAVSVPVIGVGGIETGAFIDGCLERGELSLAAVGRAILNNPDAWREAHMDRKEAKNFTAVDAKVAKV